MTAPQLRVLIADDEPLARERLRRFLRAEPGLRLVGEAADGPAAVALIHSKRPDIALLDIRLPGLSGVEVLAALRPSPPPAVIFVTAFVEHAARAFEMQAVDYLLKPFSAARFKEAIARARARCGPPCASLPAASKAPPDRVALKSGTGRMVIPFDDIVYARAANACCEVFTTDGLRKVRESLGSLEKRLPSDRFTRISRFALVNLAHVFGVEPKSHGDQHITMKGQQRLIVVRSRRKAFLARLKQEE